MSIAEDRASQRVVCLIGTQGCQHVFSIRRRGFITKCNGSRGGNTDEQRWKGSFKPRIRKSVVSEQAVEQRRQVLPLKRINQVIAWDFLCSHAKVQSTPVNDILSLSRAGLLSFYSIRNGV